MMKRSNIIAGSPRWDKSQQAQFNVRAEAVGPIEINICGYIGDDWWDETSTSEHKFIEALKGYESTRELTVNINSQGGSVKDGLGIYNAIKRWQGKTTARITGFACSIASVIPLAADRVISPKSSNWMIHDPLCMTAGNSDDHAKSIEMLESCAATMAAIYSEKTGKTRGEMRKLMKAETWMTGEEAKSFGLSDDTNDDEVEMKIENLINLIDSFPNAPQRLVAMLGDMRTKSNPPTGGATKTKTQNTMNKTGILALLKTHGKSLAEDATDEQILTALTDLVATGKVTKVEADKLKTNEAPIMLTAEQFKKIQNELTLERERRLRGELAAISSERPYIVAEDWLPRVLADESVLNDLRKQPIYDNGTGSIRVAGSVENHGSVLIESYRKLKPGAARRDFALANWNQLEHAHEQNRILQMSSLSVHEQLRRLNDPRAANTYSATLVTDRLADAFITTLGTKLASLKGFSREFGVDRLKPRATVQVRKATAASTTLTNATNFEQGGSTTTPVSVSVAQLTQPFNVTNDELNKGHQLMQVAEKNSQEFSFAINDVWTAILLVANYGATTAIGSAANFDATDLAPIYALAKNYGQKNLILDGGHLAFLLPTDKFKFRLGEEGAYNFDLIAENNRWTGAVANTVGIVCDPAALAVCSGLPADLPASEFIELGTVEVPQLGLTAQVCHWFSRAGRVHWMSFDVMFGAAAGDTTALEVLVSA